MVKKIKTSKISIFLNIVIFSLITFQCSPVSVKTDYKNEKILIKDAITINIQGAKKNAPFPVTLRIKLFTELPSIDEYPVFNNSQFSVDGDIKNEKVRFDVNKGTYYGVLEINNNQYFPLIYSDMANINFKFGFTHSLTFLSKGEIKNFPEFKCKSSIIEGSFGREEIVCPPLRIDENQKLNLTVKISDKSDFSERGTTVIWIAAIYVSLTSLTPAGIAVPIFMGPIAVERKIENDIVK
jgi:hypothetical protein